MKGRMNPAPLLISELIDHAERYHTERAVISRTPQDGIVDTNYGKVAARSRQFASLLARLGVKKGQTVGTLAWNTHRHLETYFAVSGMGAVLHTVNPRLFADQLTYIMNHAEDKVMCVDVTMVPIIEQIQGALETVSHVIVFGREGDVDVSGITIETIFYEDAIARESDDFAWAMLEEDDAAALCYTSGTTGNPKGVLYSHRSTLLHAWGLASGDGLGLNTRDSILPVVPMFHVNAWGVPYACAAMGAKLVLPGAALDGPSLEELIHREKVTQMLGVPTVWLGLLSHMRSVGRTLDSVRTAVVGGSAAPRALIKEFDEVHGVFLMHAWGMTEMSPIGTFNPLTPELEAMDSEKRYDCQTSPGRCVFGVEARVIKDDGQEQPKDGKSFGSLMVRGPWVLERYHKMDEPATDADGWFDTGDIATVDAKGFIRIVDRAKDVIKSGGEWISSIDVENMAVAHPKVQEACVIGIPHAKWDERPLLLIVPEKGESVSKEEMIEFLASKVAKWWLPDDVVSVEELPHTGTGKLYKLPLRAQYASHYAAT